ncbi:YlxM family DNA-binding protein [Sulfobacillus harzensis]
MRAGLLFDMYGPLLTDHQQEVWQLYYMEDWSLAEIGEARKISRAAVYDLLDRTEKLLEDYEARLGLLAANERRRDRFRTLLAALKGVPEVRAVVEQWAEEEGLTDV